MSIILLNWRVSNKTPFISTYWEMRNDTNISVATYYFDKPHSMISRKIDILWFLLGNPKGLMELWKWKMNEVVKVEDFFLLNLI